uniref:Putative homing endonuclease n=1 Tax=viral metagenome TaxID=1070528 RepID=A0A6H1ZFK3_9ZZZZ
MSEEHKRKISIALGGNGKSNRTNKRYYHNNNKKYKQWRSDVFTRDNWTCQTCGIRSKSSEIVYLEAHHIKCWAKYLKLRYIVGNGITLCKECHNLTKNYKYRNN